MRVWLDSWINGESLRGMIEGPLKQEDAELTVASLCRDYDCRWEILSFDLPDSIKNKVKAIPLQLFGSREDSIMWKYSKDGEFSTNSAYQLANQLDSAKNPFTEQWIWKLDMLPKIISFLCLCVRSRTTLFCVFRVDGSCCYLLYRN